LPSLCWRQLVGAGFAALRATELPKRDSSGISVIGFSVGRLTSCNVSDEFRERERIAWASLEFFRHAAIIAQPKRRRIAESIASDFKLTHYLFSSMARASARSAQNVLRGACAKLHLV